MIDAHFRRRMLVAFTLGLAGCREKGIGTDPDPPPPPVSARPLPTAAPLAAPSSSTLPGATVPGSHDADTVWMGTAGAYCMHARDTLGGTGATCGGAPAPHVWTASVPHPGGTFRTDYGAMTDARITVPDACCFQRAYPFVRRGRPLVVEGVAHVADSRVRMDWASSPTVDASAMDPALRRALGDAWRADAAEEHASIAAFARLSLELLALGAPPELLEQASRAALDEVEHARVAYGIAEAYGGEASGPAPLAQAIAPMQPPTLAGVAASALVGGCIGEGTAALVARLGSVRATDERLARILARIAEDEARHAELAWRVVGWALAEGGDEVRVALHAALAAWRAEGAPRGDADAMGPRDLAAHGRVDARETTELARAVVRDVVAPLLA